MIGTTLSHYKVLEKIGQGGMGEVYRAEDTNLDREVAIKVLPEQFTQDPQRLARFDREAKLLAQLNHPNIAAIYGFEKAEGVHFLALELVPGETLAERVAKGPLPVEEALEVCRQIAEGVEAAHEKGVIHRDLKPANVKVTPEGKVKILDFGLAKAFEEEISEGDMSQSPTLTEEMTRAGVILGTAAYMSPEQAKGKPVDKRTDVFAFGAVLYELLTGKRAFGGETITETIAAVLKSEPDWKALPTSIPAGVQRLLSRCTQKDPKRRLHHMADARLEIEEAWSIPHSVDPTDTAPLAAWQRLLPWTLATVMGITAVGMFVSQSRGPEPTSLQPFHLQIVLPEGIHLAVDTDHPTIALTPDGRQLVFVGDENGTRRLYTRDLSDPSARPIAGTEGAASLFISPDGAWIGFFVDGTLKKVSSHGGVPVEVYTVTSIDTHRGAAWSGNDTVIYAPSLNSGLYQGSVKGELKRPITEWAEITEPTAPYAWPDILPSGHHVLFTDNTAGRLDDARVAVLSPSSDEIKNLVNGATYPRYSTTGHILFTRDGSLYAVPFDPQALEVTGREQKLIDGVMSADTGAAQFTISTNDILAYVAGGLTSRVHELVWVDREGGTEALVDVGGGFGSVRLSPDGTQLALSIQDGANLDIWLLDLMRLPALTRVTFHPGEDFSPVWDPIGGRLAFASEIGEDTGELGPGLAWIEGLSEPPEQLLQTPEMGDWDFPSSWSPDGQWLAFDARKGGASVGIYLLPVGGEREPVAFLTTPAREFSGMFSPNGQWIAYVSDESGRLEVYMRPFPGPGSQIQISTSGGAEPLWSRDGRELFYWEGNRMMSVSLSVGSVLDVSSPKTLFEGRFERALSGGRTANYDVSLDGSRFVMLRRRNPVTPTVIQVVFNWSEQLNSLGLNEDP